MLGMTLEAIKEAVRQLSGDERLSLMSYLAYLRHDARGMYAGEVAGELDNNEPGNWISLSDFQKELRELDERERS